MVWVFLVYGVPELLVVFFAVFGMDKFVVDDVLDEAVGQISRESVDGDVMLTTEACPFCAHGMIEDAVDFDVQFGLVGLDGLVCEGFELWECAGLV